MITKVNLSNYFLDIACIRTFKESEWKALPRKEKRKYVDPGKLKKYK